MMRLGKLLIANSLVICILFISRSISIRYLTCLRTIECGAELEFDGNLIQVEELQTAGLNDDAPSQVFFYTPSCFL